MISAILEGLYQNRIQEKKASGLSDLVLLRAMYVKELHDVIMKGNQKALDKWVKEYKADPSNKEELSWYDDEKLDVKKLKKELAEQEVEYDKVHARGGKMFGESGVDEDTRLDVINQNKKRYEFVQNNTSKFIKDKIDKAITNSLILRWIKGRSWEGGLGAGKDVDKMFIKLQNDYGLGDDDLGDRFTRLCDFWENEFKKANLAESRKVIEATEPKRSLSKMNTNELRDYAVSLGADKKDLYGTSKQSLIILINKIEKGVKPETYSIVRIVNVGDFSSDKMEVGEIKGTILDIKKKVQQKYGKVKSINHTTKEIIIENTVSENYVNEGKVTVENFKKWLKDQVDDNNTPKDIKNFIEKQLDEIENVKKKFGDEKERKMCQRLADDIWELNLEVIIK